MDQQDVKEEAEQRESQPITVLEALRTVNLVIQFEEQHEDVDLKALTVLRQRQKVLVQQQLKDKTRIKQATLDLYFNNTFKAK